MKFRHIRSSTRGHTRIRYNLYAINEKHSPEKHTSACIRTYSVHTRKKTHRTELYEDKAINMCADKVRIQRNDVKHSHFIVIINNSVFILVCACALKFIGTNECGDASSFFDSFFLLIVTVYVCASAVFFRRVMNFAWFYSMIRESITWVSFVVFKMIAVERSPNKLSPLKTTCMQ